MTNYRQNKKKSVEGYRRDNRSRKSHGASDQPLKPVSVPWHSWLAMGVIAVLLGAAVVSNFATISWYLNRPVHSVRIMTPAAHVNDSEVRALLAAYMGEGFFNIDVSEVKQQLETHPWIASAEVKRVWPNNLTLVINEEVPIARWGDQELLNPYGAIFSPENNMPGASLPRLNGPDGSQEKVMRQYQSLNQLLFPAGLQLDALSLNERNSWEMVIEGDVRIILGTREIRKKVIRLMEIYDTRIRNDIALIERIDLRYSNGFSVKKKQQDMTGVAAR